MDPPVLSESDSGDHSITQSISTLQGLSPKSLSGEAVDNVTGARQTPTTTSAVDPASNVSENHLGDVWAQSEIYHHDSPDVDTNNHDDAFPGLRPHDRQAPYQPYRYVLEQDEEQDDDQTPQNPVTVDNTSETSPQASLSQSLALHTPPSSVVSVKSSVPPTDSEKRRARHTKILEVADPRICKVCFHQCVRKESIRKHMIDCHGYSRDQVHDIPTRNELIKSGVNVTKEVGYKAPTKTSAEKKKIKEEADQAREERNEQNHTPTAHTTHKVMSTYEVNEEDFGSPPPPVRRPVINQLSHAPVTTVPAVMKNMQQNTIVPVVRTDVHAIDACLGSIRANPQINSDIALSIIARAALSHLSDNEREKMLRECHHRFNSPIFFIPRVVQTPVTYQTHMRPQYGMRQVTPSVHDESNGRVTKRVKLTEDDHLPNLNGEQGSAIDEDDVEQPDPIEVTNSTASVATSPAVNGQSSENALTMTKTEKVNE